MGVPAAAGNAAMTGAEYGRAGLVFQGGIVVFCIVSVRISERFVLENLLE